MAMEAQGYQVEYEGRMYSSLREFACLLYTSDAADE